MIDANIRYLRKKDAVSQEEFAERFGVRARAFQSGRAERALPTSQNASRSLSIMISRSTRLSVFRSANRTSSSTPLRAGISSEWSRWATGDR